MTKCPNAKRYKGFRTPQCNNGLPCESCLEVWKNSPHKVKCPRCKVMHKWPTADNLCRKCEGEWVEECKDGDWF